MSIENISDRTLWSDEDFPQDRKNLISALTVEFNILMNDPARYPSVAESLQWVADELHALKVANNADLLTLDGYSPVCFPLRCSRIVTGLQEQARRLRGGPQNIALVAEAIKMFIVQIGRLTLYRDGSDRFACEMDRRAEEMDDFWRARRPRDRIDHADTQLRLYDLWVQLNQEIELCTCEQCTKRFLLYSDKDTDLDFD
ncbi:uncharacterized protein N7459_007939 [Penicillium hispanicum]|uniref:uncharacterized protein n=1 Tax=Penicillium hispanicum TaxID=1080232 RepID=UPI0025421342|nr:uncharacterized protein N7459_007939 [Penicillium hispanicum]KAJ5573512.1 hypothetical protein N7459_007939 [Penicillium hispanicum]